MGNTAKWRGMGGRLRGQQSKTYRGLVWVGFLVHRSSPLYYQERG